MTRKDYVLIAGALWEARSEIHVKEPVECHEDLLDGVSYTAEHLATALQRENPNFQRQRFLVACGNFD